MRSPVQQDPRIKRRLSCDLFFDGGRHSGIVLNVSRSGLFIQTSVAAKPGADVAIDLNGPSGQAFEVDAKVVWKRIVRAELMGVARGGVGLQIKRASESYYEFLASIGEPAITSEPIPPSPAQLTRYHVRVRLDGQPRTRALTVFAETEDAARRQVLQKVGEEWVVIELTERAVG